MESDRSSMKAILHRRYGPPALLEIEEIGRPELTDGGVLVRVHATSVNPADWHMITGEPLIARFGAGLRRPKSAACGVDYAGIVEAVGKNVTGFEPGDEVFGARTGAFAEYVNARADRAILPKPVNVTFEEAASVPVAALTALQGLRTKGQLEPGQQVLINGASGGVGTFAVQIAKALGAEVTAVCSTRNVDIARNLGADRVIDYTRDDFTKSDRCFDLVLDIAGNRSWRELKRILADRGRLVIVGGPKRNRWIGPLGTVLRTVVASIPGSRKAIFFITRIDRDDLAFVGQLLEDGKVTPVVDRRYQLDEIGDALAYLGQGHAQGKVVVTV